MDFSTTFHPGMDGQTECTIHTLEDMLGACVLVFKKACDEHLTLIKVLHNNNFHSNIEMSPFEALYGKRCRTP